MKKQQLRLLEILKSDSELKKDIGTETLYRCNRVWEAWNIGTMGEEDFEEVEIGQANYQHLLRYLDGENGRGEVYGILEGEIAYTGNNAELEWTTIYIDLTKNLLENSEETLEKLNDYLETIKN